MNYLLRILHTLSATLSNLSTYYFQFLVAITLGLLALAYWAKGQGDMHTLAKVSLVTGAMGLTFGMYRGLQNNCSQR